MRNYTLSLKLSLLGLSLFSVFASAATVHPARGLWIGEVVLDKVNEVSVPINAQNIPVAPNPTNATPTADKANLRIILHVNSNGVVRLLKSVAVVSSATNASITGPTSITNVPAYSSSSLAESNIVLLTDETLYPNYPGVATRFAAAAFDFSSLEAVNSAKAGEPKVDAAAEAAADAANAAAPASSLIVVSNAIRADALAAAASVSAPGANLKIVTNVVNAIVSATVQELSRVRARPTSSSADRAKIEDAASDAGALSLQKEIRSVGAIPSQHVEFTGTLVPGSTLQGTLFLGEDHPTNPFRHTFHPDHQIGFDITRKLTLTVNNPPTGETFERGGYGVDRLSGTYQEEIFGLHKPLGTQRDLGLKTQGVFTLNRISFKDTLNQ